MNTLFKEKLLKIYKNFDKVTGPYKRKDNRQHIVLNNSSLPKNTKNKLKTISYPKAIMEVHLGYRIKTNNTIDHIDNNPLNNNIINLRILDRKIHSKLDAKRLKKIKKNCIYCNKLFTLTRSNYRKDKAGPFCSRQCTGKYGKDIQMKKIKKQNKIIKPEYFTLKELE